MHASNVTVKITSETFSMHSIHGSMHLNTCKCKSLHWQCFTDESNEQTSIRVLITHLSHCSPVCLSQTLLLFLTVFPHLEDQSTGADSQTPTDTL